MSVYLCSCGCWLFVCSVLAHLPSVCEATLTAPRALDRLAFCELIPSLHLLLIASSASDRVLMVRLNRYACGGYELEVERALPEKASRSPIKGLTVCRVPTTPTQQLNGTLASTLEQMKSAPPLTQPHGPLPCEVPSEIGPMERWRVYVLFANKQLAAFEITDTPLHHPLDVRSFFP